MISTTRIAPIGITNLLNAEYIHLMKRTIDLILTAGAATLGVPAELLEAFSHNISKMIDIMDRSRKSGQTALLHKLDARRDGLLVYLLADIRINCKSPMPPQKSAATTLYLITKQYTGVQNSARHQKTIRIKSLLKHLFTEQNNPLLTSLNLIGLLTELLSVNDQYDTISKKRSEEIAAKDLGSCAEVRGQSDEQFHYLMMMASAFALVVSSDKATQFVESMNILIKETKTAYKQRIAPHKSHEDNESTEESI